MLTQTRPHRTRPYWHDLERKAEDLSELTQLSYKVRHDAQLLPEQQEALLDAIQHRIWLRSLTLPKFRPSPP